MDTLGRLLAVAVHPADVLQARDGARLVLQRLLGRFPRLRVIWANLQRRLSKDYEALCETTEIWLYISMTGLMLRRLARLLPF